MAAHVRRHRSGFYNVQYGHPKRAHARMIFERFEAEDLDVLCLTEAHDYVGELRDIARKKGHRLLVVHGQRGSDQQVILVRKGRHVGRVWSFTAGATYYAPSGAARVATQPLAAIVDDIVYVCAHAPVKAWNGGRIRRFTGPALRKLAYRKFVRRLRGVFAGHPNRTVVVWADWNATPVTRGRWSPVWLRDKVGGRFARPHANTGHGEIDFALVARGHVSDVKVRPDPPRMPHSDHKLVVASIEKKRGQR